MILTVPSDSIMQEF